MFLSLLDNEVAKCYTSICCLQFLICEVFEEKAALPNGISPSTSFISCFLQLKSIQLGSLLEKIVNKATLGVLYFFGHFKVSRWSSSVCLKTRDAIPVSTSKYSTALFARPFNSSLLYWANIPMYEFWKKICCLMLIIV